MRNLKKFLALVLAMMMTLSLMVTASAASTIFTDEDEVADEFAEAVEVLSGMGIFRGVDDTTFKPQGSVTRAQMAAVVYRLATGDAKDVRAHLYKEYANSRNNLVTDVLLVNTKWIRPNAFYFTVKGGDTASLIYVTEVTPKAST